MLALLLVLGLIQLVLLCLIWGALCELLEKQPNEEQVSARAIQAMELQTVRAMFQAARDGGTIDGRASEVRR